MKLADTIELMKSDNYKDRFKAEYWQLKIRTDRLVDILSKGDLDFTPKCDKRVLFNQYYHMSYYFSILEERAKIEGIDLWTMNN